MTCSRCGLVHQARLVSDAYLLSCNEKYSIKQSKQFVYFTPEINTFKLGSCIGYFHEKVLHDCKGNKLGFHAWWLKRQDIRDKINHAGTGGSIRRIVNETCTALGLGQAIHGRAIVIYTRASRAREGMNHIVISAAALYMAARECRSTVSIRAITSAYEHAGHRVASNIYRAVRACIAATRVAITPCTAADRVPALASKFLSDPAIINKLVAAGFGMERVAVAIEERARALIAMAAIAGRNPAISAAAAIYGAGPRCKFGGKNHVISQAEAALAMGMATHSLRGGPHACPRCKAFIGNRCAKEHERTCTGTLPVVPSAIMTETRPARVSLDDVAGDECPVCHEKGFKNVQLHVTVKHPAAYRSMGGHYLIVGKKAAASNDGQGVASTGHVMAADVPGLRAMEIAPIGKEHDRGDGGRAAAVPGAMEARVEILPVATVSTSDPLPGKAAPAILEGSAGKMRALSLFLPPRVIERLDARVQDGEAPDRSELIRYAINEYLRHGNDESRLAAKLAKKGEPLEGV